MKVAVTGYAHESNARATTQYRRDAHEVHRSPGGLAASWEARALIETLTAAGVIVCELPTLEFPAGGPVDDRDLVSFTEEVIAALSTAGRVDGVAVLGHGAGMTVQGEDADGYFLQSLRAAIGRDAPLVAVLDFHANLSPAMVEAATALVGYRTNPHVDIEERCREAGSLLLAALGGESFTMYSHSLPLVVSQIGQRTDSDQPMGHIMEVVESFLEPPIRSVSLFGGFSLADSPHAGLAILVVTTSGSEGDLAAHQVLETASDLAWSRRHQFQTAATSLADAMELLRTNSKRWLLADVSDNPGGGAPATSTELLREVVASNRQNVQMGLQCDASVVDAAWRAGDGAEIVVTFNEGSLDALAQPLTLRARVLTLSSGVCVPSLGVYRGASLFPGRSCVLRVGGVDVGVSSRAVQVADPDLLRHVGLRPEMAEVVIVKSRGHFRAGFAELFDDEQIVEVSAPGVAPVDLSMVTPVRLRRPVLPWDSFLDDLTIAELAPYTVIARGGS